MNIDRRTAMNLELITNFKSGNQKESLFGAINFTKTVIGARLLRSNILRPTTDIATINLRLTTVEEFLRHNRVFTEVVTLLSSFPDMDKMLTGLVTVPKTITQKTARIGIDTLIYLKQTLKVSPQLATAMEQINSSNGEKEPHNPLVAIIISNLTDKSLNKIEDMIMNVITESTSFVKSAHAMRHQECFALKNGIHGLLDVARKTFLQTVEDIYQVPIKSNRQIVN